MGGNKENKNFGDLFEEPDSFSIYRKSSPPSYEWKLKANRVIDEYHSNHEILKQLLSDIIPNNQPTKGHLIKASIYLSDENTAQECQEKMEALISSFSETIVLAGFPKNGSFFRRLNFLTQKKGIQKEIEKLDHTTKLATIEKIQSEANNQNAQALSAFLNSVDKNENAVALIGSLLIVKSTTDSDSNIAVRTLNKREMRFLEKRSELLQMPLEILSELANIHEPQRVKSIQK